jgi:hypothetical protein
MPARTILRGASRLAPSAPVGPPRRRVVHNSGSTPVHHDPRVLAQTVARRPVCFFGDGFIAGKVTIDGIPARRRVRVLDALTGYVVAEVWSAPDGRYRFDAILLSRAYVVLAQDHERQFNAVVADQITPERRP